MLYNRLTKIKGGCKMTATRFNEMMLGLLATADEKINVLGFEDAKPYLDKIGEMIDDLEMFWNSDQIFTETCWSAVYDDRYVAWQEEAEAV
jgi:hypothetical protein